MALLSSEGQPVESPELLVARFALVGEAIGYAMPAADAIEAAAAGAAALPGVEA